MTISSSVNKVTSIGNGVQTTFSYSFFVPGATSSDVSNLEVFVTDTSGNVTQLTSSQFSLSNSIVSTSPGGTVTYSPVSGPLPLNNTITIARILPLTQTVTIQNQGGFYPTVLDGALDTLEMQLQQVNEATARTIQAPIVDSASINLTLPAAAKRASQVLGFDSAGNVAAVSTLPSVTVSTAMQPVVSAASLSAGRTALGVGAGRGLYTISSSGTLNAGMEMVNVFAYGAKGDGTTDDTAAFTSAIATGLPVFVPAGSYKTTSQLNLTGNGQWLVGAGVNLTKLVPVLGAGVDAILFSGGTKGGGISGLTITGTSTTGNAINISNYNRIMLRDIELQSCYNGVYVQRCNEASLDHVTIENLTGSYGVKWYGTNALRSDDLILNNVNMSGSSAIGIIMDGNVDTLRLNSVGLSSMAGGIKTQNTSGGSAPYFIFSNDFEIDYPNGRAIDLGGGIRSCYFTNTYAFDSATDCNIYIDSATYDVSFFGGNCGEAFKQGIFAGGRYIRICGMNIFANGQSGSGTYPGIEIGGSSIGVLVTGNHIGVYSGQATETQNYGVLIDAGAIGYRVVGNDLAGNVSGAVSDNATDYSYTPPRSAVAMNGGSALNRFGAQAQYGASTDVQSWWGATPTTKATVTGSKGANAALTSLLSVLAAYGLITDSTS